MTFSLRSLLLFVTAAAVLCATIPRAPRNGDIVWHWDHKCTYFKEATGNVTSEVFSHCHDCPCMWLGQGGVFSKAYKSGA